MSSGGEGASGASPGPLELWAGAECTVNRVGDTFFDQLALTGHDTRVADLDRMAALGVRAVRQPVLWERTAPDGLATADWRFSDEWLGRLRALGVRPIVGLVHHGSGPRDTSLVDPAFPDRLAAYARAVAERYPWVTDYTPVNEPGTTARFSGLYGLWHPHGRDERLFVRALLGQCHATARAMRAIREVNPQARLVQTEDFGRTTCTPALAYQADYDNERHVLSIELLTGRVRPGHPLFERLLMMGATRRELDELATHPTPPDVVGVNYYLTSDRHLDHRLDLYPAAAHGGNGRHRYADVEAVRVAGAEIWGHEALLAALGRRWGLPLAITEVHLGCTREEQLRWIAEAWQGAQRARGRGVDVRAVTLWSLFGAFDWDKLVTRIDGRYEPGAFDVRSDPPRPTALAAFAKRLAAGTEADEPLAAQPGWWRRPIRVLHPAPLEEEEPHSPAPGATLLIAGARGTLARAIARVAATRGLACRCLGRGEMDIADPESVRAQLAAHKPWAVINAAGYVRVDDAEGESVRCERENVLGPAVLAAACRDLGVRFVTFSSDLVFNGHTRSPYRESEPPDPLNVYGRTKAEAERRVHELLPGALVVRSAAFFGPWDEANFLTTTLRALVAGRPVEAPSDLVVSPTYVPDLVDAVLDLLIDREEGVWHIANGGALSWAELAQEAAVAAGLDPALVRPRPAATLGFTAPRPSYSALGSERGPTLRPLDQALAAFVAAGAGGALAAA